jgi:hypothetical protein
MKIIIFCLDIHARVACALYLHMPAPLAAPSHSIYAWVQWIGSRFSDPEMKQVVMVVLAVMALLAIISHPGAGG